MAKYDTYKVGVVVQEKGAVFSQEVSVLFEDGDNIDAVIGNAKLLMYRETPQEGELEGVYNDGEIPTN